MNNFFLKFLEYISQIDNTPIFIISIIPYSFFLYFLYKIKEFNKFIKIGFTLTLLFVLITIIFSILAEYIYDKSLVEVDIFHGIAESFLTLSDLVVLYGFIKLLRSLEIKNS